jgi:hypothetical protein
LNILSKILAALNGQAFSNNDDILRLFRRVPASLRPLGASMVLMGLLMTGIEVPSHENRHHLETPMITVN